MFPFSVSGSSDVTVDKPRPAVFVAPPPPDTPPSPVYEQHQTSVAAAAAAARDVRNADDEEGRRYTSDGEVDDYVDKSSSRDAGVDEEWQDKGEGRAKYWL